MSFDTPNDPRHVWTCSTFPCAGCSPEALAANEVLEGASRHNLKENEMDENETIRISGGRIPEPAAERGVMSEMDELSIEALNELSIETLRLVSRDLLKRVYLLTESDAARMQDRLDMLVKLWSDETSFEVRYDDSDDHPWSIVKISLDFDGPDDTPTRTQWLHRHVEYSGPTLAAAVRAAWVDHGSPVVCSTCDGAGEFSDHGTPAEMAGCKALVGDRLQHHHDGSATAYTTCSACKGEGMFVTEAQT